MQIRTRLTLQFVFIVTLIVTFAFGIIYYSSAAYRRNELYQRFENKAITCAEIFASVEQIDSTMLRMFDKRQRDKIPFEDISIYNGENRRIYSNTDFPLYKIKNELINKVRAEGRVEFTDNEFEGLGIIYKGSANNFVVFATGKDLFGRSKLANLRYTLIILFFIIISILAFTGWLYAGRALRPLSNVINEVEAINVDKLNQRLNASSNNDEIGRLIGTFNILLQRIEQSFKLQKLFLSGASHELKNPLTSITSQLQVVLLKDREQAEYKQIITSILEDIKLLNKSTLDLIEFARLNYEDKIQLSELRLDDLLWFCKDYFHKNVPDYRVNILLNNMPEDPEKLIITGNEGLLRIAFLNLIDNACKFSKDKEVEVSLSYDSKYLNLSFSDKGIGLSIEEIKLIFEPFYRSNSTTETKGHGIGLALTKRIIQLHGARIRVKSTPGEGSTFSMRFRPK